MFRGDLRQHIATSSRNRPPRFGGPLDLPNAQLDALVQAGLDPETVAQRVMAAVRDNDLYIFTQPEYRGAIEERFGKILAAFDKAANAQ
jgi:hypothetical protein